ncbi:MAG: hypothetical protein ACTHM6_06430 [Tepidisphaeraceae bacterium]
MAREFGAMRFIHRPLIEPTDEFFPDAYDTSDLSVQKLFRRVCEHMEADPARITLRLFDNQQRFTLIGGDGISLGVANGTFQSEGDRFVIRLERNNIHTPMQAVATLSHEVAHFRLIGERGIAPSRWDNELLTDLCAVFLGFGIFRANAPAYAPPRGEVWPGTTLKRAEYMSLPMYGYVLALLATLRCEEKPRWARHLRGGAKSEFTAALRLMHQCKHV